MKKTLASSIGIIVPCFNQGCFAKDCVASLLRQTYSNWHAVLVNDASTDSVSGPICARLSSEKVSVTHIKDNLGRALIRNEGVKLLGHVDFIANIDCDDILSPTYVEQLVAALEANPDAGLAYGQLHYFGWGEDGKTWPNKHFNRGRMYVENQIPGPGTVFRSAALAQTAMWRRDFTEHSGEDYDVWLQIVEAGWKAIWVREAVYFYRRHTASFMAQSSVRTQVEVSLRILKHHKEGIVKTVGIENYLNQKVMPHVLQCIRAGRVKQAWDFVSYLMRVTPCVTVKLLVTYYLGRLKRRRSPLAKEGRQG